MKIYIYIRSHSSYDDYNACKLGRTNNIPERDSQYATGEIIRGKFILVLEVFMKDICIEKLLQEEFINFNIKFDGGIEFYDKRIIKLIEPFFIKKRLEYKKLSEEEISDLVRCNRDKKNNCFQERSYQKEIINFSKNELLINKKIYIELPTGGGKSYIVYNLFEQLKSDLIIIISPRKEINTQNISEKYIKILKDNYIAFNYSTDKKFDKYLKLPYKKIVICCTQSIKKLYKKIQKKLNIIVWFDEAHWGVEGLIDKLNYDNNSRFWLLNKTNIKYRIFTSASPNRTKILENEKIFGKLYSSIKVKELMNQNWLSRINTFVYVENKNNVNNINYIINDFTSRNRKYGFSFHNKQMHAFNLFKKHYFEYKNNKTNIKPFLLVSNNFIIREKVILEYNFKDIKVFENSINSIGYVVAKYSMGYDFNKLDFLCFSDPKLSIPDIKQCIGRGIRPDELGKNYSNKSKILNISLPVYIDDNSDNKYERIIGVLRYLIQDIEIQFEDIEFKDRVQYNPKESKYNSIEYNGINEVKSKLLDLLELNRIKNYVSYEKAKKIIDKVNILDKESYYKLCEKDIRLPKDPETVFKEKFINWIDYLNIKCNYYNLETCRKKVVEYLELNPKMEEHYLDLSNIINYLVEKDNLFPPNGLWIEYYKINNLQEIFNIKPKIKKIKGVKF